MQSIKRQLRLRRRCLIRRCLTRRCPIGNRPIRCCPTRCCLTRRCPIRHRPMRLLDVFVEGGRVQLQRTERTLELPTDFLRQTILKSKKRKFEVNCQNKTKKNKLNNFLSFNKTGMETISYQIKQKIFK